MRYTMLAGKIHRATVTDTHLDYEGSVTLDEDLLEAAHIPLFAQVQIYNITNGERFVTYAIRGRRGSGEVILNGAAAHKASRGDIIIVACYAEIDGPLAMEHHPYLAYVDGKNRLTEVKKG
jgi:aspartate 1-decarboxylase